MVTTARPGALLVGSSFDYRPFEYRQGKILKGFDVEIVKEINRRLGLKVEWVNSDFDTIFDSLAAGRFDAVAAAATIKPERTQLVDFSDPYFDSRQSLTVNASKTPAPTSSTTASPWARTTGISSGPSTIR
ncbi:MAG TPA: transporter substrate-binding domain-containing protein [Actinomycetota bacterium]|nr:transporter substrate-binding domain-containing protein [Actinomycetota bacterium]